MSDIVKSLRTLARIDTADSEYAPDEHIAGIAADHIEALEAQLAQYECEWSPEDDYESSNWSSGCGAHWEFFDDGPVENGVEYCFRCGGKVVIETPPEQTP